MGTLRAAASRSDQRVPEPAAGEAVRQIVGAGLSEEDAAALAEWYAALARGVTAFPQQDLKAVEPPLRSTPGPPT
jgi:cytochrome c553